MTKIEIAIIIGIPAIVGFVIAIAIREDVNSKRACRRKEGRVDEHCQTFVTLTPCGNGCLMPTPITSCTWQCVDVPAEDPRGR